MGSTTAAILTGAAVFLGITGPGLACAHADGNIDATEAAYITKYGPTAVCPVIDEYPTTSGVMGVLQGVMHDGFAADSAVDIVNASVHEYCPDHWALLVSIGKAAREADGQPVSAGVGGRIS